jgi:hypothetical protein
MVTLALYQLSKIYSRTSSKTTTGGFELLLIEYLQSGVNVLLQFCLIHRDIVLLNKMGLSRAVWLSDGKFLAETSSISFSHN